ncbi:MAG: glycosyltransferase family 2 protein [Hyphomicrobiaceae bacterium]|nr:glycosyltransferase family 2 protein [Hyphomicrobiaceae bacterium]
MTASLISVVIPVLDESQGLQPLLARLTPVLERIGAWEIVFVDDGSADGTLDMIRAAHQSDPRVRAVALSRNFGKEIAIAAGLRYARGDAVVIMDADLQHPPEVIEVFEAKWRAGYQVVYGERLDRASAGTVRRLLSRAFYRTFNALSKCDIPEGAGDFRLLDRRAVDAMNSLGERSRFNKGLFSWIGFRSIGVPYVVADRLHGPSRWRLRALVRFALDGLTSFTTIPLRIWSLLGLALSLTAFASALVYLVRTLLFGVDVPGFPSLIISVMIFSGVQLISLGVIGEYLGRVYEEVKARPLFIVAEEIGTVPPGDPDPAAGRRRTLSPSNPEAVGGQR